VRVPDRLFDHVFLESNKTANYTEFELQECHERHIASKDFWTPFSETVSKSPMHAIYMSWLKSTIK